MKRPIYYYTNEHTDEVVNFNIKSKEINEKYKYIINNPLHKLLSFFIYYVIATPLVWFYYKIIKKVKFHNLNLIKNFKENTYFIFANHTNKFGDAFLPALVCSPKKPRVIAHADNISIPFVGWFLKMCGALPLPGNLNATKNFYSAIEQTLNSSPIVVYPEAHLWPYYTKIRQFNASSFRFPIKYNKPIFIFTTTYKLKKLNKKPKVEIYIDGPIYPNQNLPQKQAQHDLRDKAFSVMSKRSLNSNYEYAKYIKRINND